MTEVSIHLEDMGVIALQRPPEPRQISPPQPLLTRPMQHKNPPIGRSPRIGQLPGAIGRIVIHHQHIGHRQRRVHRVEQAGQILALVIGRDHHQGAHVGHHNLHRRGSKIAAV